MVTLSSAFKLCKIDDSEIVILRHKWNKSPGWYSGMHFIRARIVRDKVDMKKIKVHHIDAVHSVTSGDFLGFLFEIDGISEDILNYLENR